MSVKIYPMSIQWTSQFFSGNRIKPASEVLGQKFYIWYIGSYEGEAEAGEDAIPMPTSLHPKQHSTEQGWHLQLACEDYQGGKWHRLAHSWGAGLTRRQGRCWGGSQAHEKCQQIQFYKATFAAKLPPLGTSIPSSGYSLHPERVGSKGTAGWPTCTMPEPRESLLTCVSLSQFLCTTTVPPKG